MELQQRAITLATVVPPRSFLSWNSAGSNLELSVQQLRGACQLAAFEFLVTRADLGVVPVWMIPQGSSSGSGGLHLYHCPIRAGD